MGALLGKGWKTLTGAILWAVGHVGIIGTVLGLLGIHTVAGQTPDALIALWGEALAVVGIAHKVNRFNWSAFMDALNTLLTALADIIGKYVGKQG